ncbi:hypothetical protein O181_118518, partial [Austropuccinia psidii MF-1]|nr:hypothetical protein [Austropuccinia psidii MF-1]
TISPKPEVGPPEPNIGPNPQKPKMAHVPQKPSKWPHIVIDPKTPPMASGSHQGPPAQFQKRFPSIQRKLFPSVMDPTLQEPGMGNIW